MDEVDLYNLEEPYPGKLVYVTHGSGHVKYLRRIRQVVHFDLSRVGGDNFTACSVEKPGLLSCLPDSVCLN